MVWTFALIIACFPAKSIECRYFFLCAIWLKSSCLVTSGLRLECTGRGLRHQEIKVFHFWRNFPKMGNYVYEKMELIKSQVFDFPLILRFHVHAFLLSFIPLFWSQVFDYPLFSGCRYSAYLSFLVTNTVFGFPPFFGARYLTFLSFCGHRYLTFRYFYGYR